MTTTTTLSGEPLITITDFSLSSFTGSMALLPPGLGFVLFLALVFYAYLLSFKYCRFCGRSENTCVTMF